MQIECQLNGGLVLLRCQGELTDGSWVQPVANALFRAPLPYLVMDMREITYLNSTGLCHLMDIALRLKRREGCLMLVRPQSVVMKVLRDLDVLSAVEVYDSLADARSAAGATDDAEDDTGDSGRRALLALFDRAEDAIVMTDASGKVIYCNEAGKPVGEEISSGRYNLRGYTSERVGLRLEGGEPATFHVYERMAVTIVPFPRATE